MKNYQSSAMGTCTESCNNLSYMLLNLVGEVGELSSKVAKHIRKENIRVEDNQFIMYNVTDEDMQDIKLELGDILWQLSGVCTVLGFDLDEVANLNLEKLQKRKERGTIVGNGDHR